MEKISRGELKAFIRMKEEAAANAAISQSDSVVIRKSEGNVPGVYITADQKQQDAYAQQIAMNNVPGLYGQSDNAGYYGNHSVANMNYTPQPAYNPNASYEAPRNVTADANGNIVIY